MTDPDNPSHSEPHVEHKAHEHEMHEHDKPVHEKPAPHKEAEPKEEKEEPKSKSTFLGVAAVIQILLLIFIAFQLSGMEGSVQGAAIAAPSAAAPSPSAPTVVADVKELIDDDAIKGDPNAPVTIVEWSDFECPFCARFYSQTLAQIDEKYIKTGKVNLVYRDFPLSFHAQAQKSAEAAECAGEQGKYFEMHDILFENGVAGGVDSFKRFAQQIGLNTGEFNTCLDSGSQAAEVRKDFSDGQRAGISGTPGFIVDGKLISGAQPFSVFEQAIEAALS